MVDLGWPVLRRNLNLGSAHGPWVTSSHKLITEKDIDIYRQIHPLHDFHSQPRTAQHIKKEDSRR